MIAIFIGSFVIGAGMRGIVRSPNLSDGAALGTAITLVGALVLGLGLADSFFQYFGTPR
jgi:hypothetical protein